jgi:hypothetical protein
MIMLRNRFYLSSPLGAEGYNFKPYYQTRLQERKPAIMSVKKNLFCRKCSLVGALLLLLQVSNAQSQFSKVDDWMKDNVKDLEGRELWLFTKTES